MKVGLLLVLSCALLLGMPMAISQTSPSEGFDYRLEIACPAVANTCPVKAIDPQDAMGDPSIAVDPFRPERLIVASLHGAGDNVGAPSAKSRSGQVFTTFTSTNGGGSWEDNPFTPPAGVRSQGTAYGEHPSITLSPYGDAFIGSLYSTPRGEGGFDYILAAQKFRRLAAINENQDGGYNAEYLTSVYPGNKIQQMWYSFNRITDNMTIVWTEVVTPASTGVDDGFVRVHKTLDGAVDAMQAAARGDAARVAAAADAAIPDPAPALGLTGRLQPGGPTRDAAGDAKQAEGPMSVIGVAWTDRDPRESPKVQQREHAIGPCQTSTNPVIKEGWLYVGCVVADEGPFRWNPNAAAGDIEMFRMDPDGGEPQYIGPAPIEGGNPKIGVRSDGRVALMTVDVDGGALALHAVYGGLDGETGTIRWGPVVEYGADVPMLDGFLTVDANIQDLIYREYSGVIHLILKRVVERDIAQAGNVLRPYQPTIHKAVVALDERHGFLFYHPLDIGSIANRTQDSTLLRQSEAVFNDIADDFLELPPLPHRYNGRYLGDHYQREFFAVGDYGVVIFAELVEITDLRGPVMTIPALPPPPAPAPAPAAVSTTAVAGAFAASGVTAFAAARMHRLATVGAKKKR